jgi:heat shock protein HslJ
VAPSVTFEDGRVAGSTGCNRFTAPYTVDAIEITALAATEKACATPDGIMEQEAAYLAALLPTAVRYRVEAQSLQLLSAEGTHVVSYTRVPGP